MWHHARAAPYFTRVNLYDLQMAMSNSKALEKALTGAVSQVLSQLKRKEEDSSSDDMDDFRPAKKRSATFNIIMASR